jgi:hypothetical protein
MKFKVGDKVVGNAYNYLHRFGQYGTIESVGENGTWVRWDNGDKNEVRSLNSIDLVDTTPEPTTPRKMHPDDFMLAISEFAADNGFGVTQLDFYGTEFIGAALPSHSYSV